MELNSTQKFFVKKIQEEGGIDPSCMEAIMQPRFTPSMMLRLAKKAREGVNISLFTGDEYNIEQIEAIMFAIDFNGTEIIPFLTNPLFTVDQINVLGTIYGDNGGIEAVKNVADPNLTKDEMISRSVEIMVNKMMK